MKFEEIKVELKKSSLSELLKKVNEEDKRVLEASKELLDKIIEERIPGPIFGFYTKIETSHVLNFNMVPVINFEDKNALAFLLKSFKEFLEEEKQEKVLGFLMASEVFMAHKKKKAKEQSIEEIKQEVKDVVVSQLPERKLGYSISIETPTIEFFEVRDIIREDDDAQDNNFVISEDAMISQYIIKGDPDSREKESKISRFKMFD